MTIRCAWSNSGIQSLAHIAGSAYSLATSGTAPKGFNYVKDIYEKLLKLQESRILFDIWTGKRRYPNMLFRSISLTTDETTENALSVTIQCKQVILVRTRVVTVPPREKHKAPDKTAPVEDKGTKQPQKGSGLFNVFGK